MRKDNKAVIKIKRLCGDHENETDKQFQTVKNDDDAADDVDPSKDFFIEAAAEDRDEQRDSCKPETGGGSDA